MKFIKNLFGIESDEKKEMTPPRFEQIIKNIKTGSN